MLAPPAIAALALSLSTTPASAQDADLDPSDFEIETTGDLLEACTAEPADPLFERAISFCLGYVIAALHYDYAIAQTPAMDRIACPPETVTLGDVALNFIEWAEANPAVHDSVPVEGVMQASEEEWPCP